MDPPPPRPRSPSRSDLRRRLIGRGGGGRVLTMAPPQTRRELSSLSSSPSAGKPVDSFFAWNVLRCALKVKGPSLSMINKTLASREETARRVWRPCPFWTLSSWLLSEPSRGTRTLIRTTGPQCKAPRSPLTFFFLLHAIDEGAEYATSSLGRHYFKHHFGS